LPAFQLIVDLWPCDGSGLPCRMCRVCGCTDEDCSGCIARTGFACSWAEDDLCSACHVPGQHVRVYEEPPAGEEKGAEGFEFFTTFEDDGVGGIKLVDYIPDAPKLHRIGEYRVETEGQAALAAELDVYREYIPGKHEDTIQLDRVEVHPAFTDLSDQASGNALLHGIADMTGNAQLKEIANQGGVAWMTDRRIEGESIESVEYENQVLGEFVDVELESDRWLRCPGCRTSRPLLEIKYKFRNFQHHFRCEVCQVEVIGEIDDRPKAVKEDDDAGPKRR
jgi:hypothetical protein